MQWYVLRVAANKEMQVKEALLQKVQREDLRGIVGRIEVPVEQVKRIRSGKQTIHRRKLYPGYVFMEVADNYIPVFPQIMKLSDKDINAIKSILDTARKRGDFNLAALASEKVKNHLKIETSLSPFDFLDTLLKDYNYLSVK